MRKKTRTLFSTVLMEVIDSEYNGNKAALGRACKIPAPTLCTLTAGEIFPSTDRLTALAEILSENTRFKLLKAAAIDRIPEKYRDEIFNENDSIRSSLLPDDMISIINYIEDEALNDPVTADLIRAFGKWLKESRRVS